MSFSNNTIVQVTEFVLLCFHGDWSWWKSLISAALLLLLLLALSANLILVSIIWIEQRLHTPIYFLLASLSSLDFVLSTYVLPPVLHSIWSDTAAVSSASCFMQTFFIPAVVSTQSFIFMVMAHDHYVAIYKPLQYPLIINNQYLLKVALFTLLRCIVLMMPVSILTAQLHYCASNVLYQCYCVHLSVITLACDHNPIISIYVFVASWFANGFDISFIFFSHSMIIHDVFKLRSSEAFSKACSTCASHLIVISYYYTSLILLVTTSAKGESIPTNVHGLMSVLYCVIPPVVNPLVYGLRTKEVKERLKWIFQKIKVNALSK